MVGARARVACLAILAAWSAGVRAGSQASSELPRAFFDATYLFNAVIEGGSEVEENLAGVSHLLRVRLVPEDRFLSVQLAEDAYSNPADKSLVAVVARFPLEATADGYRVFWGDDPSPFVIQEGEATYRAEGRADVSDLEHDPARGALTFVKKLALTDYASGEGRTVRLRINFLRMPESSYQPRVVEDPSELRRYGFFAASQHMLADAETGYLEKRRFMNRIDVSKPFVYELHPSVPAVVRPAIRDALEDWNQVFDEVLGVRPFRLVEGSADHMPGDLRYHVIYFRTRGYSDSGYSAYGPPVSIASTGEIVDADVVVDGTAIMSEHKTRQRAFEAMKEKLARLEEGKKKAAAGTPAAPPGLPAAGEPDGRTARILLNDVALPMVQAGPDVFPVLDPFGAASGPAGPPDPAQALYRLMRGIMCHEFGHNLGLRHNFGGSADKRNLAGDMVTTSVMDYVDHARSDSAMRPGPYDKAAIAFGYGGKAPDGVDFLFLTDADAESHPLANRHDLGDPLLFYASRIAPLLGAIKKGEKPKSPLALIERALPQVLLPVLKFVNNLDDPRSAAAFQFLFDLALVSTPAEARYRPIEYVSKVRYLAALLLLNAERVTGQPLTRRQRQLLMERMAEAALDNTQSLEPDRLALIALLASERHVSALNAVKKLEEGLAARLGGSGVDGKAAEIEENVLLAAQRARRAIEQ